MDARGDANGSSAPSLVYVLAAAGLPVLALLGTPSRIRYLVPILAVLYALPITYQVILLRQLQ